MSQFGPAEGDDRNGGELSLPDQIIWRKLCVPPEAHERLVAAFRRSLETTARSKRVKVSQRLDECQSETAQSIKDSFRSRVLSSLAHDGFEPAVAEDPEALSIDFHSEFGLSASGNAPEVALLATVHNDHRNYVVLDHSGNPTVVPAPAMTILVGNRDGDHFQASQIYSAEAVEYLWALLFTDLAAGKMADHNSPLLDSLVIGLAQEFELVPEEVFNLMLKGDFEMTEDWKIAFEIDDCPYVAEIRLNSEGSIFIIDADEG